MNFGYDQLNLLTLKLWVIDNVLILTSQILHTKLTMTIRNKYIFQHKLIKYLCNKIWFFIYFSSNQLMNKKYIQILTEILESFLISSYKIIFIFSFHPDPIKISMTIITNIFQWKIQWKKIVISFNNEPSLNLF